MHILVLLCLAFYGLLLFPQFALFKLVFQFFVELELLWELVCFAVFNELKVVIRVESVNLTVQISLLNKSTSRFSGSEVVDQGALADSHLDSFTEYLLLRLQCDGVGHERILLTVHVSLHVSCVCLDKLLETVSSFSLCFLAEALTNAVLQDFVDEILLAECFLLLSMLANYTHDFT